MERQEEFTKETGNFPIINDKLTKEYKSWLIRKENERILLSQQQSTVQPQTTYQTTPVSQPQAISQPQRKTYRNTNLRLFCA